MSEALWASRARPTPGTESITLGAWTPAGPNDLSADRRALATAIVGRRRHHANAADGEAIERLLLAFEELVSNGLRHGLPPVRAVVTAFGSWWLVEVSDAAVDHPPTPAWGRDAAQGGLGLPLVARICAAHGWHTDGARKNVWALLHQRGTRLAGAEAGATSSATVAYPGMVTESAAGGVPPARDPGGRGSGAVAAGPRYHG